MATFDTLIDDLASRFGLGANARIACQGSPDDDLDFARRLGRFPRQIQIGRTDLGGRLLARPSGRWPDRRGAESNARSARLRSAGSQAASASAQGVVSTALGYALPKIVGLLTPGGVVPAGVPAGGHGFSLASSSCGGHRAGCAEADRRSSVKHAGPAWRRALAMAGARRAGRRCVAFLFLVDA